MNPVALEQLARQKFGDLTDAELRLIRAIPEGMVAECSPNPQDPKAPDNDLAHAESWAEGRKIRATMIRWLCLDSEARSRVDPRGVSVRAAWSIGFPQSESINDVSINDVFVSLVPIAD
jgi:hypothetical protein